MNERLFRIRLLAGCFIVGFIPVVAVGMIAMFNVEKYIYKNAFDQLELIRTLKTEQVEEYFQTLTQTARDLAASPAVIQWLEQEQAGRTESKTPGQAPGQPPEQWQDNRQVWSGERSVWVLAQNDLRRLTGNPDVAEVFLISKKGDIILSTTGSISPGNNLHDDSYKQTGLTRAFDRIISDPLALSDFTAFPTGDGRPAAFITVPVVNPGGSLVGAAAVKITIQRLVQIMRLPETQAVSFMDVYLVGPDHRIRVGSRSPEDKPKPGEPTQKSAAAVEINKRSKDGTQGAMVLQGNSGSTVLAAHGPLKLPDLRWTIIAEMDQGKAFVFLRQFKYSIVIVCLVAVILGTLAAFLLARQMSVMAGAGGFGTGGLETELAEIKTRVDQLHARVLQQRNHD